MSAEEVLRFVRAEYWRLARAGAIPYALPVVPTAPTRPDHRDA